VQLQQCLQGYIVRDVCDKCTKHALCRQLHLYIKISDSTTKQLNITKSLRLDSSCRPVQDRHEDDIHKHKYCSTNMQAHLKQILFHGVE